MFIISRNLLQYNNKNMDNPLVLTVILLNILLTAINLPSSTHNAVLIELNNINNSPKRCACGSSNKSWYNDCYLWRRYSMSRYHVWKQLLPDHCFSNRDNAIIIFLERSNIYNTVFAKDSTKSNYPKGCI